MKLNRHQNSFIQTHFGLQSRNTTQFQLAFHFLAIQRTGEVDKLTPPISVKFR